MKISRRDRTRPDCPSRLHILRVAVSITLNRFISGQEWDRAAKVRHLTSAMPGPFHRQGPPATAAADRSSPPAPRPALPRQERNGTQQHNTIGSRSGVGSTRTERTGSSRSGVSPPSINSASGRCAWGIIITLYNAVGLLRRAHQSRCPPNATPDRGEFGSSPNGRGKKKRFINMMRLVLDSSGGG